jgi:integrase
MAKVILRKWNGTIKVIVHKDGKRWVSSTNVNVADKYWKNDHLLPSCPEYTLCNNQIMAVYNNIIAADIRVRNKGEEPTVKAVRSEYELYTKVDATEKEQVNHDIITNEEFGIALSNFIMLKRSLSNRGTFRIIDQVGKILAQFFETTSYIFTPESFDDIQFGLLIKFMRFDYVTRYTTEDGLKKIGLIDSTIHVRVRWFRAFLRWAYPQKEWKFVTYKSPFQEDIVSLTEDELERLMGYELSGYLDQTRDLFVFQCLSGMRYSDTQRFERSWVTDGVFDFRMLKTGGRAITPMFQSTEVIVKKYDWTLPHLENSKYNKYLKELFTEVGLNRSIKITKGIHGEIKQTSVPLWKAATTHVARKTFITICLSKGIPIQDVMKMSGHSDYKSIKPYIDISREHIKNSAIKWNI